MRARFVTHSLTVFKRKKEPAVDQTNAESSRNLTLNRILELRRSSANGKFHERLRKVNEVTFFFSSLLFIRAGTANSQKGLSPVCCALRSENLSKMSSLESLKLGGIRNALRKLLRKKSSSSSPSPSPAVDTCSVASTPAGGQLADGHASHPLPSPPPPPPPPPPQQQQNGKSHDPGLTSSPLPPSSPHPQSPPADKTASSPVLATTADGYRNGVNTHESTLPTQDHNHVDNMVVTAPLGDQKQPQQKLPSQHHVLQDSENKENVPPGEEFAASLAGLKLDGSAKEDGEAAVPDLSYLDDPVVAAERAEHLRFIGEALDMVSLCRLRPILQIVQYITNAFPGPPGPKNQRDTCWLRLGPRRQNYCQRHERHQRHKKRYTTCRVHGSFCTLLVRPTNWLTINSPQTKGSDR